MPDPEPSAAYTFDLDGGRPCLDFANTASTSGDHLQTYADLLAFASQSHLLTPDDAARLQAESSRAPSIANATVACARHLREAVRGIFTAVVRGQRPPAPDLHTLNLELAASLVHARVVLSDGVDTYAWTWADLDLAAPLWPLVRSAADLLTSDEERRLVRECGASDCAWLFLDSTRNRSRQWCSMASCGNREKARRHYQRVRTQRASGEVEDAPGADGRRPRRRAARTPAAPAGDASATAD